MQEAGEPVVVREVSPPGDVAGRLFTPHRLTDVTSSHPKLIARDGREPFFHQRASGSCRRHYTPPRSWRLDRRQRPYPRDQISLLIPRFSLDRVFNWLLHSHQRRRLCAKILQSVAVLIPLLSVVPAHGQGSSGQWSVPGNNKAPITLVSGLERSALYRVCMIKPAGTLTPFPVEVTFSNGKIILDVAQSVDPCVDRCTKSIAVQKVKASYDHAYAMNGTYSVLDPPVC